MMKNKDSKKNSENLITNHASGNKRTWQSPEISLWTIDQIEAGGGPKIDGGVGTYLDG